MPTTPQVADMIDITLVDGRHLQVRAALADRVHGIDSDGDVLVTLGEPGHPIRHENGSQYLIPLTSCCQADGKGSQSSTGVVCRRCYREVDSKYASHGTIAVARDLTGLLVRWEYDGQWLTARVAGTGVFRNSVRGKVVDPGNHVGLNSSLFGPQPVQADAWMPNLQRHLLTIIDESHSAAVDDQRADADDPDYEVRTYGKAQGSDDAGTTYVLDALGWSVTLRKRHLDDEEGTTDTVIEITEGAGPIEVIVRGASSYHE
jgi:hypothetical protein